MLSHMRVMMQIRNDSMNPGQMLETVDMPLSKGQPDGAEKTVDMDTDGALETMNVDMGSNS